MAARLSPDAVIELTVRRADGSGEPLKLARQLADGPLILGRGMDSPIPLEDPSVSRRHLLLSWRDGRLWIEVLSQAGAVVDGKWLAPGRCRPLDGPAEALVPCFEINIGGGALIEMATAYTLPPLFGGLTRAEWLLVGNTIAAIVLAALYFAYL